MDSFISSQPKAQQLNKSKSSVILKRFVVTPFKNGIAGFSFFFVLLILTKLFGYIVGLNEVFEISAMDVLLSTTGFVLVFTYKALENIGGS